MSLPTAPHAPGAQTSAVWTEKRKLGSEMPALATHLDATILTGTFFRYRTTDTQPWLIERSDDRQSG